MKIFVISLAAVLATAADGVPNEQQAETETQGVPGYVDTVFLGARRPILFRFHLKLDGRSQPTVWLEQLNESFRQFDHDGSGGLTGAELSKVPWAGSSIAYADFNEMGKLLRRYRVRDEICDDEATQQELIELAKRLSPLFRVTSNNTSQGARHLLFSYLDTDQNGRLTIDELNERALSSLRTTDLNDDEASTVAELMQMARPALDGQAVNRLAPRGGVARSRDFPGGSIWLFDFTNARDLQSEKSLQFFTSDMLKLSDAAFDRADSDGNDLLDIGELAAYLAKSTPDVELRVHLGERKQSQPAIELIPPPPTSDSSAISVNTATDGLLVLEVDGCRFEFTAANIDSQRNAEIYQQQFANADTDNNDYLDSQEIKQNGFFQGTFSTMDIDGDGKLFAEEMKSWLERQMAAAASRTQLSVTSQGQPLFQLLDINSDGRLTARELKSRTSEIARYDHSKDGGLTINELPERFRMQFQQGQPAPNRFGTITASGTRVDTASPPNSAEATSPPWFRRMDHNRDNDVSRREFIGPLAIFDQLDTNSDDLIDAIEAEQLRKR